TSESQEIGVLGGKMIINAPAGCGTTISAGCLSSEVLQVYTLAGTSGSAAKTGGGTWANSTSDGRLKDIVGPYNKGLEELSGLEPFYYHYKADNPLGFDSYKQKAGLSAQDVQKIFPESVSEV